MSSSVVNEIILVGYSGHAYVVVEAARAVGYKIVGYCDQEEKESNPQDLLFFGQEESEVAEGFLSRYSYFVAIGDNKIRKKVYTQLSNRWEPAKAIIHPKAYISPSAEIKNNVLVGMGAVVNAFAVVGKGVILNSNCIVEHECQVGNFAHIAPGAVLTGNVKVGERAFIGAGAVIKPGVQIGAGAIVGAGTVVLQNVGKDTTIVGNPARLLNKKNK